jgi:uncharacterized membrane protein
MLSRMARRTSPELPSADPSDPNREVPVEGTASGESPARTPRRLVTPSARGGRREPAPAGHLVGIGVVSALAATAYAVLGLVNLANFRATTFDLVIFDQTVRGYAGFGPPTTPAVGAFHGQGLDFLQLADHFSPILAVLAPLYWVHAAPATLIVAQSVLFALAIPPLWVFTRRKLGAPVAYLVAVAYATSAAIAQAAGFDFHEVAFVPLLTAVMVERFDRGRVLHGTLAAAALLLVKEDMGLLVAGFGCYLLVTRRWRTGAAFVLGGLLAVVVIRGLLVPAAGGDPATFWAYNHLGSDVPGVLHTMVTDPGLVLRTLVSPEMKVDTMLGLVWPLAFACLLSPLVLPAVPLVLERMLSDRPFWWTDTFQYDAFVIVVLLCAAVDGVARVQRWVTRRRTADEVSESRTGSGTTEPGASASGATEPGTAASGASTSRPLALVWAAGICGISLALVPQHYLGRLLEPSYYRADPSAAAAAEAAETVPSGVVVDVVNNVGPALTDRATVLLWEPRDHDAPWVVADTQRLAYPFPSLEDQQAKVPQLLDAGYRVVYERDGYVVLHRPSGE